MNMSNINMLRYIDEGLAGFTLNEDEVGKIKALDKKTNGAIIGSLGVFSTAINLDADKCQIVPDPAYTIDVEDIFVRVLGFTKELNK